MSEVTTQGPSELSTPEIRDAIMEVEKKIIDLPGSFVGNNDYCPLKHSFAPGVYVREIFIPAGTILTGKIHKYEHPNFLMSGEVTVFTESGGAEKLTGPVSMISPALTKRIVYAHTDVVWITVHATDETDVGKIEEEITLKSYEECEQIEVET